MKKIISMAVMLYITMTAMAQKGELAMNENIRGKENVSRNVAENTVGNTAENRAEKEATPVGKPCDCCQERQILVFLLSYPYNFIQTSTLSHSNSQTNIE